MSFPSRTPSWGAVMRGSILGMLGDIRHVELGGNETAFRNTLAKEQGWDRHTAELAMEEYRKFMVLVAHSPEKLTPSITVDKVWHAHLTCTREYWGAFCGALGKPIHHDASVATPEAAARDHWQYLRTMEVYAQAFGTQPPADVWPQPVSDTERARLHRKGTSDSSGAACGAAVPMLAMGAFPVGAAEPGSVGAHSGAMGGGSFSTTDSFGSADAGSAGDGGAAASCGGSSCGGGGCGGG